MVLTSAVAALALATSCGTDTFEPTDTPPSDETTTAAEPTGTPPSEPDLTEPSDSDADSDSDSEAPAGDGNDAATQVQDPSGPYDLILKTITVKTLDGDDRVVLRFAGEGKPGWAARFVEEAVLEGSGDTVDLDGESILRLDISGTPTQPSGEGTPVRQDLGGDVVDAYAVGAWEGYTQVFLGLRGDDTDYRVSAHTGPSRLVIDLD